MDTYPLLRPRRALCLAALAALIGPSAIAAQGQAHGLDKAKGKPPRAEPGPPPAVGGYFRDEQRQAATQYYGQRRAKGHCPPGLAKKNNGCQPPGQAKKWKLGQVLPQEVRWYPVPQEVVVKIGLPPSGYRYVRVLNDILLIAIGTRMVIDAIEDLIR